MTNLLPECSVLYTQTILASKTTITDTTIAMRISMNVFVALKVLRSGTGGKNTGTLSKRK